MVLVAQNTGQEEGSFVRALGLKAPPGPTFSVNRHVPLLLDKGPVLVAPSTGS